MAFVSSSNNNNSSTNRAVSTAQAVNTANGVFAANTQVNAANIDKLSDAVIYGFKMANGYVDYEGSEKGFFKEYGIRKPYINANEVQLALISPKWSATTTTRRDILLKSVELQEIKTTRTRKSPEGVLSANNANSTSPTKGNISCLQHLTLPFYHGLDEFVNKPVVENRKSDEEVSKVVRKSDDSPIIKDWVSD
ncbi:hypothetical protein Tco_0536929 [Tanacetum coccineum]